MGKKVNGLSLAGKTAPFSMSHAALKDIQVFLAVIGGRIGKHFRFGFNFGNKNKEIMVVNFLCWSGDRWSNFERRAKFIAPKSAD